MPTFSDLNIFISFIAVGCLWGSTNPLIKQGTLAVAVAQRRQKKLTGISTLDTVLAHLATPSFIIPQLVNLTGSVLFTASLGSADLSVAVPLANGTSLVVNALVDHYLGDGIPLFPGVFPGVFLTVAGIALCATA